MIRTGNKTSAVLRVLTAVLILIGLLVTSSSIVHADSWYYSGKTTDFSPGTSGGSVLFEQLPADISSPDWRGYISASYISEYISMDDFWGLSAPITDVHWYGFFPEDVSPTGIIFEIKFYEDDNGSPGSLYATFSNISPTFEFCYTKTIEPYSFETYRFDVEKLETPVDLEEGWVSIYATYLPGFYYFAWLTSPDGNSNAIQKGEGMGVNLAFSLTSSPDVTAAKSAELAQDINGDGLPGPGDTLKYTAVISNEGAGTASDVKFSDSPDANTALVAGSVTRTQGSILSGNNKGNKVVEVYLGTILPGGEAVVTFQVTIDSPLWELYIANQASVTGSNFDPIKSDDPGTQQKGDPTVTNIQSSPPLHGPGLSRWGIITLAALLGGAMIWITGRKQIKNRIS